MRMNPSAEMWEGLTDIPLVMLTFLFGILLKRRQDAKRGWAELLFFTSLSALDGVIAHTFYIPEPWISLIWCVEYALLFEMARRFAYLLTELLTGKSTREKTAVRIIEGVLWAAACVLRFLTGGKDIYMLVAFMGVMTLRFFMALVRVEKVPKALYGILVIVVIVFLLQAFAEVLPGAVVIEHGFLAAGLFLLYRLGRKSLPAAEESHIGDEIAENADRKRT